MNSSDPRTILKRLADRTLAQAAANRHADRGINFEKWQWHQGVALHGLLQAFATLGDERYLQFVKAWVDRQLAAGSPPKSINTTAPLLAVARLSTLFPGEGYAAVCQQFAEWCLHEAPRLPDGTFEHSCTENRYPQQVWADTLFMGGVFLAQWGQLTGERKYAAEAARQFVRHYGYLEDTATGLIYHGYYGLENARRGVLWGRGNGWFAAASVAVLDLLDESFSERATMRANFQRHLAGLLQTQDASGAWHTVMDRPETYLEMSCTAAFAYALGQAAPLGCAGAEHRSAQQRALACLLRHISADGELTQASGGTPVLPKASDYNAIPYGVTSFSQGLAMLAFSAASRPSCAPENRAAAKSSQSS